MPSASPATATVVPPVYGRLDLGEVNSMLNGHREFLAKAKGRNGPLETPERERPGRWNTYSHDPTGHASHHAPARLADSVSGLHDEPADHAAVTDARPPPRAWKTEHRIAMGPEKAWSIGSGESPNSQDGQVEKSITEVLAGVEPNARSRKASHSLRFFKEGLPDDKARRKDQRAAQSARERSPARAEKLADIEEASARAEGADPRERGDREFPGARPDRVRSAPTGTPVAAAIQTAPEDYFVARHVELLSTRDATAERAVPKDEDKDKDKPEADEHTAAESADPGDRQLEPRGEEAHAGAEAGDSAEDGEESGEEKISSAVFLPHQAPDQTQDDSPVPGVPQRAVLSRRHSRHDDFHPWLVKADEPEIDDHPESVVEYERKARPEAAHMPPVAPEVAFRQVDEPAAPFDDSETGVRSSHPSRPPSQYPPPDEAVQDPHLTPNRPLEAIELIPYKHQVGGHTTLWRFSRRAVCKQLNNRENEFYEKVEKYHRDLLAFLPRYVQQISISRSAASAPPLPLLFFIFFFFCFVAV